MGSKFVISDKDVLSAINYAISWNEENEATINVLIRLGADIFGVNEEDFEDILNEYRDY